MGLFNRTKTYTWDGYWETDYKLKTFRKDERVDIIFEDELSELPTPTPAQYNAVTYIINNQKEILNAVCQKFLDEYDYWKDIYEEHLPEMKTIADVQQHIGISAIYVDVPEKENTAYVGFSGYCSWDEEHGIGFYLHKNRVLKVGGSDEGFSGTWTAYEDLGITEDIERQIEEDKKNPKLPLRYEPHPKYCLKPSQEDANRFYFTNLIERGFTEVFKVHVEKGEVSVNDHTGIHDMTFLQRACQCNNASAVEFILTQQPLSTKGCVKQAASNLNLVILKQLIAFGCDINEMDTWFKDYPIDNMVNAIGTRIRNNATEAELEEGLKVLEWAIANGANPKSVLHPEKEVRQLEHQIEDKAIVKRIRALLTT